MSKPPEPTAVPVRAEDVLATESQEVTVLMSMDTGKFVELNDSARAIWDLTDGETSVASVAERLVERFEVGRDQCLADVTRLYARLGEEGLVVFGG